MKSLDLTILEANRNASMMTSDEEASVIIESMLPHKRIITEMLGSFDHQARMETYGH